MGTSKCNVIPIEGTSMELTYLWPDWIIRRSLPLAEVDEVAGTRLSVVFTRIMMADPSPPALRSVNICDDPRNSTENL